MFSSDKSDAKLLHERLYISERREKERRRRAAYVLWDTARSVCHKENVKSCATSTARQQPARIQAAGSIVPHYKSGECLRTPHLCDHFHATEMFWEHQPASISAPDAAEKKNPPSDRPLSLCPFLPVTSPHNRSLIFWKIIETVYSKIFKLSFFRQCQQKRRKRRSGPQRSDGFKLEAGVLLQLQFSSGFNP